MPVYLPVYVSVCMPAIGLLVRPSFRQSIERDRCTLPLNPDEQHVPGDHVEEDSGSQRRDGHVPGGVGPAHLLSGKRRRGILVCQIFLLILVQNKLVRLSPESFFRVVYYLGVGL